MNDVNARPLKSCPTEEELEKQAQEFFDAEQAKYLDRIQTVATKHAQGGNSFGICKEMTLSSWKTYIANGWEVFQREVSFRGFRLESYTPYQLDQRFTDLGELVTYLESDDWAKGKRFVK